MMQTNIPPFLSHLPVDPRGYVIPFFVAYVDGKPDFRLLDQQKQHYCIEKKLCSICGKKIKDNRFWFISGPIGFHNRVSSDPGMHERCARYSLKVCPHLYFHKADRRDSNLPEEIIDQKKISPILQDKPKHIVLTKADKYHTVPSTVKGHVVIRYRPIYAEQFAYQDNTLQFDKRIFPTS